jgi:hypothetical protein
VNIKRQRYHSEVLNDPAMSWNGGPVESDYPDDPSVFGGDATLCAIIDPTCEANLVSSQVATIDDRPVHSSNLHAPALDLDVPAWLVPSKTEGHSHLYIDVPMTWDKYQVLLEALEYVGILEPGYVKHSKRRSMSMLRSDPQSKPKASEPGRMGRGDLDDVPSDNDVNGVPA